MGEHYDLTLEVLCKLMELKGEQLAIEISKLGGVEGICEKLRTSPSQGLGKSVDHRRVTFGSNIIKRKQTKTFLELLWNVLCDEIFLILLIVSVVTLFDIFKFICVVVIVVLTTIVDYFNEKKFQSFLRTATEEREASVIRNAVTSNILVSDVVVGDVCVINNNSVVPADGILIESEGLKIDESSINGNSGYACKNTHFDPIVLCGSVVVAGNGIMVVTAVGDNTRTGFMSSILKKEFSKSSSNNHCAFDNELVYFDKEKSVFRHKLIKLFRIMVYVCLFFAVLTLLLLTVLFTVKVFVIEGSSWRSSYLQSYIKFALIFIQMFSVGISEAIPLAVVIVLAISIRKLYKDNNVVRRLHSCETMGNVTSICFDPNGTITTNRIAVVQSYICERQHTRDYENNSEMLPVNIANLIAENISSTASMVTHTKNDDIVQIGDKTECALLDFVQKIDLRSQTIRDTNEAQRHLHVFPFNSDRKLTATVIQISNGCYRLYVKGASEVVLSKCKFIFGQKGKLMEITNDLRASLLQDVIQPMKGTRSKTISLAYRDFVTNKTAVHETIVNGEPNWSDEINILNNLTCLCILGIEDSIRSGVPSTIENLKEAGMTVRMVTGDHIDTAESVAVQCGIIETGEDTVALDAIEFNRRIRDSNGVIQQQLFDEVYPTLRVVARASPMDKYNLVNGIIQSNLNKNGEVVAMVGNGDGDALALRKADVGITFNQFSTEVAKEACDIILIDDTFGGIIKTVVWGRNSYDSIAKFVQFVLSFKLTLILLFFSESLFIGNLDIQLHYGLWTNLFLIVLALVPVFFTNNPSNYLYRPHGRNESIISKIMLTNIVGQSIYQMVVVFAILFISGWEERHANIIGNTFVLMTLFNMFNATKLHAERNVFDGIVSNFPFCAIWVVAFGLNFLAIQYDVDEYFGSKHLIFSQWLWCLLFGIGILVWQQLLLLFIKERKGNKTVSRV